MIIIKRSIGLLFCLILILIPAFAQSGDTLLDKGNLSGAYLAYKSSDDKAGLNKLVSVFFNGSYEYDSFFGKQKKTIKVGPRFNQGKSQDEIDFYDEILDSCIITDNSQGFEKIMKSLDPDRLGVKRVIDVVIKFKTFEMSPYYSKLMKGKITSIFSRPDLFQNPETIPTIFEYIIAHKPYDYQGQKNCDLGLLSCTNLMWQIINGTYKQGQFFVSTELTAAIKKQAKITYTEYLKQECPFFISYIAGDEIGMMQAAAQGDNLVKLIEAISINDKAGIAENLKKQIAQETGVWMDHERPSSIFHIEFSTVLKAAAMINADGSIYRRIGTYIDEFFQRYSQNYDRTAYNIIGDPIVAAVYGYSIDAWFLSGESNGLQKAMKRFYDGDKQGLYDKLISLKYSYETANTTLANLALEKNDYANAKSYFLKAQKNDSLTLIACKLMDEKKYDEAFSYYCDSGLSQNNAYQAQAAYFIKNDNFPYANVFLKKAGLTGNATNMALGAALINAAKYERALEYFDRIDDPIQKQIAMDNCYQTMGNNYLAAGKSALAIEAFAKLSDPSKALDANFKAVISLNKREAYQNYKKANPDYQADEINKRLENIASIIAEIASCKTAAENKFNSGDKEGAFRYLQSSSSYLNKKTEGFPDALVAMSELRKLQEKYYSFTTQYQKDQKEANAAIQAQTRIKEMVYSIDQFTSRASLISAFGSPAESNVAQMAWYLPYGNELRLFFDGIKVQVVYLNGEVVSAF